MNKIQSTLGIAVLSSVLLLTACAKKPSSELSGKAGASNAVTQTYAMKTSGYKVDANGFVVNALLAPANQVYYFAFNNSEMRQTDLKALLMQADYLASHAKVKIRLEGNTDNRGSREYNIGLAWRRAQSVGRILEEQGVKPKQIQMVSYGKENPAVLGNNTRAWALDRRVDLIYKSK